MTAAKSQRRTRGVNIPVWGCSEILGDGIRGIELWVFLLDNSCIMHVHDHGQPCLEDRGPEGVVLTLPDTWEWYEGIETVGRYYATVNQHSPITVWIEKAGAHRRRHQRPSSIGP